MDFSNMSKQNKHISIYIIENRFNNSRRILITKMIIFIIFHIFSDTFRQIELRIIDAIQKTRLKSVVPNLPVRKSGNQVLKRATRSVWLSAELKACIHNTRTETGTHIQNREMIVRNL
jgi:hypothetical protein